MGSGCNERDIRDALAEASRGLVYSSESDRPFEVFQLRQPTLDRDFSPAQFARALVPGNAEEPVEERTLERFFARHTDTSDPYDSATQAIRPRYEALVDLLRGRLQEPRVIRIGRIEIACYAVGWTAEGDIAGLKTVAIET